MLKRWNVYWDRSKLEYLDAKWAICEDFLTSLYCLPHFNEYTDFNPSGYLISTIWVNDTGQKCVNEFSNFSFSIYYKPVVESVVANPLSRYPALTQNSLKDYNQHLDSDGVRHVFNAIVNQKENNKTWVTAINVMSNVFD